MAIDLLKLAKRVEDTYKEVESKFIGKTIRVYHVPDALIWTYLPDRPKPVQPTVKMKIATGQTQDRLIKPGDEGWDDWVSERDAYEEEKNKLQAAARYVETLRDVIYPNISQPPPIAQHRYSGCWPKNETLRKKVWLDHTLMAAPIDAANIQTAIMEMIGGVYALSDAVDELKKNSESTSGESPSPDTKETQKTP